jgi:Ca-activated chloride channel homolog
VVISDGDPQPPTTSLLNQMKADGITYSGVAVFPHNPGDSQNLQRIAQLTGGRFYDVSDPQKLPQIFIKEAQTVRRALIIEETFTPTVTWSLSEVVKGLGAVPPLDGYVLTGPKEGLSQVVLTSGQGDPVLATCQSGLGRCLAFTSSIDSRWASNWLAWPGDNRFWEQAVRWTAKPAQPSDCEVMVDVQGRQVDLTVDAVDEKGAFVQFSSIDAQLIGPDMSSSALSLSQAGPGEYRARFEAPDSGSYIVNLRYRKPGADTKTFVTQTPVTVPFSPEFRDLSDNAGLLMEASSISGGRVLSSDPNAADLYTRAGLKLPQTQLPTSKPLMILWLALLLLDVAVRRVAVDWRALARRIRDVLLWRPARKSDETIDRLKVARNKVRDKLAGRGVQAAGRHYEASSDYAAPMPTADIAKPAEQPPVPKVEVPAAPVEDKSHIQQLLKAKRKAAENRKDNEKEEGK